MGRIAYRMLIPLQNNPHTKPWGSDPIKAEQWNRGHRKERREIEGRNPNFIKIDERPHYRPLPFKRPSRTERASYGSRSVSRTPMSDFDKFTKFNRKHRTAA